MKNKTFLAGAGASALLVGLLFKNMARRRAAVFLKAAAQGDHSLTALITGASSGIGAEYARQLAARGYQLILVGRRIGRLQEVGSHLSEQYGVGVEILCADLSTLEGIDLVERRIIEHGAIDFLVNNAGFGLPRDFAQAPIEQVVGMINCHNLASVRFTRAAINGMLQRNFGAIVNVSSTAAYLRIPGDITYIATKAYLNVFSESLHLELLGTNVRVQALCPGYTMTEFHDRPEYAALRTRERIPGWLFMDAFTVVDASLKDLATDKVICIPGVGYRLLAWSGRSGLLNTAIRLLLPLAKKIPASFRPGSPNAREAAPPASPLSDPGA
jgi:short-subunit dehydrogenase